jgi:hypothetical protein
MRRGVLVVRLERVRERLDRRDERLLQALEAASVRDRELRLVRDAAEEAQLALLESLLARLRQLGRDAATRPSIASGAIAKRTPAMLSTPQGRRSSSPTTRGSPMPASASEGACCASTTPRSSSR